MTAVRPGNIVGFRGRAPVIRLPGPDRIFAERSDRFARLAQGHPLGEMLRFMSAMAKAQRGALAVIPDLVPPPEAQLRSCRGQGLAPLGIGVWPRDQRWKAVLRHITTAAGAFELPVEARNALARLDHASPEVLDRLADGVLRAEVPLLDRPLAPFVSAALQVYWTAMASVLDHRSLGPLGSSSPSYPTLCPVCGSGPVACIVRTGGDLEGLRYLCCGLCNSEWHLVRIKCAHCGSTESIGYYGIEGDNGAVKAETCERCRSYLKIMYMEKDADVDPVADDLDTLPLDILLAEQGWHRLAPNPFLLADSE